jgi:mRNA-degrading endonuclease YafQ of YafQ-DinJ toxin-antitoxin module
MEIRVSNSFRKQLQKKPRQLSLAITECMERLVEDPSYPSLRAHKMGGTDDVWEARADRGNRLTFRYPESGVIEFLSHCNHDILRRPG